MAGRASGRSGSGAVTYSSMTAFFTGTSTDTSTPSVAVWICGTPTEAATAMTATSCATNKAAHPASRHRECAGAASDGGSSALSRCVPSGRSLAVGVVSSYPPRTASVPWRGLEVEPNMVGSSGGLGEG